MNPEVNGLDWDLNQARLRSLGCTDECLTLNGTGYNIIINVAVAARLPVKSIFLD